MDLAPFTEDTDVETGYELVYETDLLEGRTSKGLSKFWRGQVVTNGDGEYYTRTITWQLKADGTPSQKNTSDPKRAYAKNVGKANETTPCDQAISEIESAKNRKRDSGYLAPGDTKAERLPLPMLAHRYDKRGHDITFPAYCQPKLDGHRMLFDGEKGWTRKGKLYIPEVIEHLLCELPDGIILDGELMLPAPHTFEETTKAIKKYRPERSPLLQYHVYDIVDSTKTFKERAELLAKLFPFRMVNSRAHLRFEYNDQVIDSIRGVITWLVDTEDDLLQHHTTFVEAGFEGTMVRNATGLYKEKHRSADLQKLKDMEREEFPIIGVTDGEGREEGCAIFLCRTPEGKEFSVRPIGSVEQRKEWFENRDTLIREMLSVQFQELTDDGIPRFPVGVAIRPEWDM